ncbi:MAG: DNA-processing protein DprA [Leptolyngbya sp.]|nr:DNA-processing protein DprA [Leptolyngbya sp.]
MSSPVYFTPDHPSYPTGLRTTFPAGQAPTLSLLGDQNLLNQPALALFCSVKCPGDLILNTYDLAQSLRDAGVPVISGFHSPMEKECLLLLMRGTQPMIHCPARSLEDMRLSPQRKVAIKAGRLLLLSPFSAKQKRATTTQAEVRNRVVGVIASSVFIAYAAPGSKTEAFAQNLVAQGKPILTFESSNTHNLVMLGARTLTPQTAPSEFLIGH